MKKNIIDAIIKDFDDDYFKDKNAHYCDFCAEKMNDNYQTLPDGRERCERCSASLITTLEECNLLLKETIKNFELFFKVKNRKSFKIKLVSANDMAKLLGYVFKPTKSFDSRTVTFLCKELYSYTLYLENESPKLNYILNIVHEFTQLWQFKNWNHKQIAKAISLPSTKLIYEGMPAWVGVQYMYFINEIDFAKRIEKLLSSNNDLSSRGFRIYKEQFPFVNDHKKINKSPFERLPKMMSLEEQLKIWKASVTS